MRDKKILYGVCGIGLGHTFRQLPLIEHFASESTIVLFAYGESYRFFASRYAHHPSVSILPVSVPFFVGKRDGLDFAATARRFKADGCDPAVNLESMGRAQSLIGRPDLVISDYEPVCARYAYACDAPLVSFCQQNKYLAGDFPAVLNGQSYDDEVARLRMFFPAAAARLACSFFQVSQADSCKEPVIIYPPILKQEVLELQRSKRRKARPSILVYLSSQQSFVQELPEVVDICRASRQADFHIFVKDSVGQSRKPAANVSLHSHGEQSFLEHLGSCSGIVSTAGHSLLSEAMHIGIPVYAIPLPVYEQQMNALVIEEGGFGISRTRLDAGDLQGFVGELETFSAAIAADRRVLLRGHAKEQIIDLLTDRLLAG